MFLSGISCSGQQCSICSGWTRYLGMLSVFTQRDKTLYTLCLLPFPLTRVCVFSPHAYYILTNSVVQCKILTLVIKPLVNFTELLWRIEKILVSCFCWKHYEISANGVRNFNFTQRENKIADICFHFKHKLTSFRSLWLKTRLYICHICYFASQVNPGLKMLRYFTEKCKKWMSFSVFLPCCPVPISMQS